VTISPIAADRVRKVSGYALAISITLLLFRVLGRAADGLQSLADVELWGLLALVALAVVWVRAARRVRRVAPPGGREGEGPPAAPP
jgi:hypothetical protein